MPQQPRAASLWISSAGKFFLAVALGYGRAHFGFHKLADGVANQFLVVAERKIHRFGCTRDANTGGRASQFAWSSAYQVFCGENEVKVSKETSVLFEIQIQHPPDRREWAQFHNRAEDDTSFAAQ